MNKLNKTLWYSIPFTIFVDDLMHCYLSGEYNIIDEGSSVINHIKMIIAGFAMTLIWDFFTYLAYVLVLSIAHIEISKSRLKNQLQWFPFFYGLLLLFVSLIMTYVFRTGTDSNKLLFFLGHFFAGFFQGLLVWRVFRHS